MLADVNVGMNIDIVRYGPGGVLANIAASMLIEINLVAAAWGLIPRT